MVNFWMPANLMPDEYVTSSRDVLLRINGRTVIAHHSDGSADSYGEQPSHTPGWYESGNLTYLGSTRAITEWSPMPINRTLQPGQAVLVSATVTALHADGTITCQCFDPRGESRHIRVPALCAVSREAQPTAPSPARTPVIPPPRRRRVLIDTTEPTLDAVDRDGFN